MLVVFFEFVGMFIGDVSSIVDSVVRFSLLKCWWGVYKCRKCGKLRKGYICIVVVVVVIFVVIGIMD